jgi:hypothetical protein
MFDYFFLADLEKARSSAPNSAFNTPATSRMASPAASRRTSLDVKITKEVKVNAVKPKTVKFEL